MALKEWTWSASSDYAVDSAVEREVVCIGIDYAEEYRRALWVGLRVCRSNLELFVVSLGKPKDPEKGRETIPGSQLFRE